MTHPSLALHFALVWAMLCAAPSPSQATTMRFKSLRELVRGSDVTLLGEPVESQSFWQGTRIMTRVRVQVREVWSGTLPQHSLVDVITPGGVVGDIGQRVDGAAVLSQNTQVVLHLRRHEGEYWPTAMAQGVWVVPKDPLSQALIRPGADHLVYGLSHNAGGDTALPKTLKQLRLAVEEASRGQ